MEQQKLPMVYVDETGFAPSTCRVWGRAARGQRVYGTHDAQQRPRTSLIGGYAHHTLLAPMLFEGTCNTEVFNHWLEHMLLPTLRVGSVIIMDNARFHQSARTRELIDDAGCELVFLSPYSPDLNPIEKRWANLKRQWQYASHLTLDQFIKYCDYL
jgi:transposase